jgi:drug/metabolite transporter (DMT)-like permease
VVGRVRPYFPELALLVASALYGSTFVVVQDSLEHVTPSGFNVLRFGVAALALGPVAARRRWRGPAARPTDSRRVLTRVGVGLGLAGLVAYQTQNIGLHHTTTSNSGFITGLFVVFTPAIAAVRVKRWPPRRVISAVALALVGLFLLTGASFDLGYGDAVTIVSAFAWAVWMVATGEVTRRFDTFHLILVEVLVIGAGSAVFAAFEGYGQITGIVVIGVLATGVGCSAFAFALSTWAQRVIEPERAGVINLFEPVVVGVIGFFVGERLGAPGYLGAVLILASILVVEHGTHRRTTHEQTPGLSARTG